MFSFRLRRPARWMPSSSADVLPKDLLALRVRQQTKNKTS